MTLALEMFAVAPATGKANLSAVQESLLAGKAHWLHQAAEAGLPTVPTIAITRAAWDELQAERLRREERLRTHWVATLFRLVGRDGKPPPLVVRTSAEQHAKGPRALGGKVRQVCRDQLPCNVGKVLVGHGVDAFDHRVMRQDKRFGAELEHGAVVFQRARGRVGRNVTQGGDEPGFAFHPRGPFIMRSFR